MLEADDFVQTGPVKFTVTNDPKMMTMLITKIYSDKVLAAERETMHNARDAMVEAGKGDQPIVIHLPSYNEPYFSVRDDGLGLSPRAAAELYTTFGASTKDDATALAGQAGKLGLGSKSPLAVVNDFTVISRYNGVQRTYTVFRDEEGYPNLSEPETVATEDCNGLEIRWAVPRAECYKYKTALTGLLEYFRPLPIVVGLTKDETFKPIETDIVLSHPLFNLRRQERHLRYPGYDSGDNARAVQAMIVYPVKISKIDGLTDTQRALLGLKLDLLYTGDVLDFTPGREELSYDAEKTVPSLKASLNKIAAWARSEIDKRFKDVPTRLEALRLFGRIIGTDEPIAVFLRVVGARWKGETITDTNFRIDLARFKSLRAQTVYIRDPIDAHRSRARKEVREYGTGKSARLDAEGLIFSAHTQLHVYFDDLEKGGPTRFNEQVRERSYVQGAMLVYLSCTRKDLEGITEQLDGVTIRNMSEFVAPKAPKAKTSVKRLARHGHRPEDGFAADYYGKIKRECLYEVDVDPTEDKGFYITMRNTDLVGITTGEFNRRWSLAVSTGLFNPRTHDFIIVPSSLMKQFEGNPNWKPILAHFEDQAKALIAKPDSPMLAEKASDYAKATASRRVGSLNGITGTLESVAKLLPDGHAVRALFDRYDDCAHAWERGYAITRVAGEFNLDVPAYDNGPDLLDDYERVRGTYKLLDTLLRSDIPVPFREDHEDVHAVREQRWNEHVSETANYIGLVDGQTDPKPSKAIPVPVAAGRPRRFVGQPAKTFVRSRQTKSRARA